MNPLTIYQDALNGVSKAVLAGDFDTYAAMIDLPYLIHTQDADLLVSTTESLRPTFDALHGVLKEQRVTHYERVAREADFADRDRIEGWHHTHLISHGERLSWPHVSRHGLVRRGTAWLFSEAHYSVQADRWPVSRDELIKQFNFADQKATAE